MLTMMYIFQDNIKDAFDLNGVYENCLKNPLKKKDKKPIKSE